MSKNFEKVKQYLQELELPISEEIPEEELVIVNDEENGIRNLYIDCEDPILIFEQVIMAVPKNPGDFTASAPEPGSLGIMGLAFIGIGLMTRRRK